MSIAAVMMTVTLTFWPFGGVITKTTAPKIKYRSPTSPRATVLVNIFSLAAINGWGWESRRLTTNSASSLMSVAPYRTAKRRSLWTLKSKLS